MKEGTNQVQMRGDGNWGIRRWIKGMMNGKNEGEEEGKTKTCPERLIVHKI
jgi:hypothetical protein